jgi:hypothetical protein
VTSLVEAFEKWYGTAEPGIPHPYYRGYLAVDRGPESRDMKNHYQLQVHHLADAVYDRFERGHVTLAQRREAPDVFIYYAIKTKGLDRRQSIGRNFSSYGSRVGICEQQRNENVDNGSQHLSSDEVR